ncbi:SPW repeat protein [Azospirillum rugosum]|uniref:MFS family arabinose efflux permease n=1 Tax=Azospirillum rugosum TaxID=416170 RepID=A0ABS4SP65_9PROT|nr:SPW repeat protein [Azospirillum rugosum]MBP2294348.1 putative MFS family arabinose efflux permease [Azospirillum rugosum]MDQ0527683.1 putative MFS family arabinose efflux permease [Azospirillum rugosum]
MTYATWKDRKDKGIVDMVNLLLGAALFLGPWLYGFMDQTTAAWNAWITGAVMIVLAAAAIFSFAEWEEWVNLVVGLWAVVAPWVLGFAGHTSAMWSHVVVGLAVAVLSAAVGWYFHRNPPRLTA